MTKVTTMTMAEDDTIAQRVTCWGGWASLALCDGANRDDGFLARLAVDDGGSMAVQLMNADEVKALASGFIAIVQEHFGDAGLTEAINDAQLMRRRRGGQS